ncbi:MAG: adenylate/guanylate cyclase domain-containing protein, partial [Ancrocorticia sp.]
MPITTGDTAASGENVPSTVERYVNRLLGGPERYTLTEAADLAGMGKDYARRFWLSMGFPTIADEENDRVFTDDDVAAMTRHQHILDDSLLAPDSLNSLIRAESHMSDRLVLWQHESLVEHAERVLGLDSITARYWVLDHFEDFHSFMQDQMQYSWQRHLASLLRRSETEVTEMDRRRDSGEQLQRAVGFVDMVAFTNRSNEIGSAELVDLIEVFEHTCRDVISANGARVVKTIG